MKTRRTLKGTSMEGVVEEAYTPSNPPPYPVTIDSTKVKVQSYEWESKTWNGLPSFSGSNVWTDGDNIYYSWNTDQYVLNRGTSTWESKTWNGLTSFSGSDIWTDGENIYYSHANSHYVLNRGTSTWESKTWNGLPWFFGSDIWTDGNDIYYSGDIDQYKLTKAIPTTKPTLRR